MQRRISPTYAGENHGATKGQTCCEHFAGWVGGASCICSPETNACDVYHVCATRPPRCNVLPACRPLHTICPLTESGDIRIDKWLWAARVFKTRAQSLAACRAGHVKIKGAPVKPGRPVRVGDTLIVRTSGPTRTLDVLSVTDRRVGAKLLPTLFVDRTPPEELERLRRTPAEQVLSRPKGSGRPTKRELRRLDRWLP